jgi:hypothetical protein
MFLHGINNISGIRWKGEYILPIAITQPPVNFAWIWFIPCSGINLSIKLDEGKS